MKPEKIKLEIRICPETQKPFVCDQDGRRVAAVTRYSIESPIASAASVTLTAHLHAGGKKYGGASDRPMTALERGEAIHKALLDEAPSMKLVDILARELRVWPDALGVAVGQCCLGHLHCEGEPENSPIVRTAEKYSAAKDWFGAKVTRAEWQAAVDALNADRVEYSPAMHAQRVGRVKRRKVGELKTDSSVQVSELLDMGYLAPFAISCNWPRRAYSFGMPPGLHVKPETKAEPKPVEWDGEGMPPVGAVVMVTVDFKKAPPYAIINLTVMGVDVLSAKPSPQKVKVLYASDKYVITMPQSGVECMAPTSCVKFEVIQTPEQIAAEKRASAVSKMVDSLKRFNSIHEACGMLYDAGYLKP